VAGIHESCKSGTREFSPLLRKRHDPENMISGFHKFRISRFLCCRASDAAAAAVLSRIQERGDFMKEIIIPS